MRVLECSSKGDKRFSALYAKVEFGGKMASIESHYQSVKRGKDGEPVGKGKYVDHILISGKKLSPKYLTPFYKLLWVKYLRRNKELVSYAEGFDKYNDMFRGKAINCQADVIRDYVKHGDKYVVDSCKEFIDLVKK